MISSQPKSDGELLAAFAQTGSQAAFTELVQRHGAMVHGICCRVLGDPHEAQDAAQAVFLALASKAASLRKDPSLGGWLHHVAVCVARDARISRARRQQREDKAMQETPTSEVPAFDQHLFQAQLDTAIDELPERYRKPLVLFHLESKSLDETGSLLGLNPNTLRTRLGRARELLRQKLVRRGITISSVGALTVLLSAESGAAVLPQTFVVATVNAVTGTSAVSAGVSALTQGAIHAMFIAKVKTVSLAAAACLVLAGTGIVAAKQSPGSPSSTPPVMAAESGTKPPTVTTASQLSLPEPTYVVAAADPSEQGESLTATVKAAKESFGPFDPMQFIVTFSNKSADDILLEVMEYLGSQTAGRYTPMVRNVATGQKWQYQPSAARAPARMQNVTMKPGQNLNLPYNLSGSFVNGNGTRVARLPEGNYELTLTIEVNGLKLAPAPAAFAIVGLKPLTQEQKDKAIALGREALAKKLAKQAEADAGAATAGAVKWSALKADKFHASVEQVPAGLLVKLTGDVPNSNQVVTWSVNVTDKGVHPDAMMQGFVISLKGPPPVIPAAPPQP